MPTPTCISGDGCGELAVKSTAFPKKKLFCRTHQDQLDRCREELTNKNFVNTAKKNAVLETFCKVPDCPNRPVYGTPYCADHPFDPAEEAALAA